MSNLNLNEYQSGEAVGSQSALLLKKYAEEIILPKCLGDSLPGMAALCITSSGYRGSSKEAIIQMTRWAGATYTPELDSKKSTHLICWAFKGPKFALAKKLSQIMVVNHRWLEDCLLHGKKLSEHPYSSLCGETIGPLRILRADPCSLTSRPIADLEKLALVPPAIEHAGQQRGMPSRYSESEATVGSRNEIAVAKGTSQKLNIASARGVSVSGKRVDYPPWNIDAHGFRVCCKTGEVEERAIADFGARNPRLRKTQSGKQIDPETLEEPALNETRICNGITDRKSQETVVPTASYSSPEESLGGLSSGQTGEVRQGLDNREILRSVSGNPFFTSAGKVPQDREVAGKQQQRGIPREAIVIELSDSEESDHVPSPAAVRKPEPSEVRYSETSQSDGCEVSFEQRDVDNQSLQYCKRSIRRMRGGGTSVATLPRYASSKKRRLRSNSGAARGEGEVIGDQAEDEGVHNNFSLESVETAMEERAMESDLGSMDVDSDWLSLSRTKTRGLFSRKLKKKFRKASKGDNGSDPTDPFDYQDKQFDALFVDGASQRRLDGLPAVVENRGDREDFDNHLRNVQTNANIMQVDTRRKSKFEETWPGVDVSKVSAQLASGTVGQSIRKQMKAARDRKQAEDAAIELKRQEREQKRLLRISSMTHRARPSHWGQIPLIIDKQSSEVLKPTSDVASSSSHVNPWPPPVPCEQPSVGEHAQENGSHQYDGLLSLSTKGRTSIEEMGGRQDQEQDPTSPFAQRPLHKTKTKKNIHEKRNKPRGLGLSACSPFERQRAANANPLHWDGPFQFHNHRRQAAVQTDIPESTPRSDYLMTAGRVADAGEWEVDGQAVNADRLLSMRSTEGPQSSLGRACQDPLGSKSIGVVDFDNNAVEFELDDGKSKGLHDGTAMEPTEARLNASDAGAIEDEKGGRRSVVVASPAGGCACAICREERLADTVGILACDHVFCFDCIVQWADKSVAVTPTCPLCKKPFDFITTQTLGAHSRDERVVLVSRSGRNAVSAIREASRMPLWGRIRCQRCSFGAVVRDGEDGSLDSADDQPRLCSSCTSREVRDDNETGYQFLMSSPLRGRVRRSARLQSSGRAQSTPLRTSEDMATPLPGMHVTAVGTPSPEPQLPSPIPIQNLNLFARDSFDSPGDTLGVAEEGGPTLRMFARLRGARQQQLQFVRPCKKSARPA